MLNIKICKHKNIWRQQPTTATITWVLYVCFNKHVMTYFKQHTKEHFIYLNAYDIYNLKGQG